MALEDEDDRDFREADVLGQVRRTLLFLTGCVANPPPLRPEPYNLAPDPEHHTLAPDP